MIEITPQIIGPGIEEEYADILSAISDLRAALGPRPLTNDTPDGRLLLEMAWVEQEVLARRLPIPIKGYTGTLFYLVGSGELDDIPGARPPMKRLYWILQGYGLIKPRHIPVLLAMISDLCSEAQAIWDRLSDNNRAAMEDMRTQGELIQRGGWPAPRKPQDRFFVDYDSPLATLVPNFLNKARRVTGPMFEERRPYPARKPALAAPVHGLPATPPPLPRTVGGTRP